MVAYEIKIPESLKRLNIAAAYVRARAQYLGAAMDKSVATTKARVQGKIPIGVTGQARSSVTTSTIRTPFQMVGKISSSLRRPNVYIFVLNAGVRPGQGKQPPSDKLVPWVVQKGLARDPKEAARVAYLVARSIKRKGITALSFQWRGLSESESAIEAYHRQAVEDIIRELDKNA